MATKTAPEVVPEELDMAIGEEPGASHAEAGFSEEMAPDDAAALNLSNDLPIPGLDEPEEAEPAVDAAKKLRSRHTSVGSTGAGVDSAASGVQDMTISASTDGVTDGDGGDEAAIAAVAGAADAGDGGEGSAGGTESVPGTDPEPAASAVVAAPTEAATPEIDPDLPQWDKYEKSVFILSIAGKPIYSRYGNEDKLASLMGVMQALVSFIEEDKNELRSCEAGKHRFVFLLKGAIILVMVASTGETAEQMGLQLNYVFNQIIFVLTQSQLTRIFQQRINYDLRRMLTGTERFLDNLLDMMSYDPCFFLTAVRCLPLPLGIRDKIGGTLQSCRIKDLVFAVLIADNQLITLLRPKKYSLHPVDLHMIFNLVAASTSFKSAESWTPLCLPKFNNTGFLHAHVSYIDAACTACLFLISNNKDVFPELSNCRGKIVQSLSSNGCLQAIGQALARPGYLASQLDIPNLRHFIYKSKSSGHFTAPEYEPPYNLAGQKKRLFLRYQDIHHQMHSATPPLKIYFRGGQTETLLGWVTSGFELYAAFGPLVTKPAAINAVLRLIRWMKREEDRLFIINSQVF